MSAWNLLSNGHGAIDWAGFGRIARYLGVAEVDEDDLIHRLGVIKAHRPPEGMKD